MKTIKIIIEQTEISPIYLAIQGSKSICQALGIGEENSMLRILMEVERQIIADVDDQTILDATLVVIAITPILKDIGEQFYSSSIANNDLHELQPPEKIEKPKLLSFCDINSISRGINEN
ncbi:MAG: hypothetical protein HXX16_17225 [Bacteroidales bacterium]|nr:hypothetical protein [Bacteroidales bacterium]